MTIDLADVEVAGRKLADYREVDNTHGHDLDQLVGYVVRETLRDGQALWHGDLTGRGEARQFCGYDVAVVDGAHRFAEALTVAYAYRDLPDGYALVDHLYSCGCRS